MFAFINIWHLKLYPAGHNIVIYDAVHKTQKIIATSDKGEDVITAISVSPNKRYRFILWKEKMEREKWNLQKDMRREKRVKMKIWGREKEGNAT